MACISRTSLRIEYKVPLKLISRQVSADLLEKRYEYGPFGPTEREVWPEPEKNARPRAVVTYKLDHFLSATHGKNHISLSRQGPEEIDVSLICEGKSSGILHFDLFYSRNREREKRIFQKAAWQLAGNGAAVEGMGSWTPAPPPQVRSAHGAMWIAYRGTCAKPAVSCLLSDDYKRLSAASNRGVFVRELEDDPEGRGGFAFFSDRVEWESREKVLVKTVEPEGLGNGPVTVVGAKAEGGKHIETFSFLGSGSSYNEEVGEVLARRVLKRAALAAAVQADHLEFVSPLPWTEPIELEPWKLQASTDRHLEEERKAGRSCCCNTAKSRFWQGCLRRNGKTVIVTKYYRYTGKQKRAGRGRYVFVPEFVAEEVFEGEWKIHFNPDILEDEELAERVLDAS